jgi:hypothetical protein
MVVLFAQHWPPEAEELTSRSTIEQTIDRTADELATVIKRLHRRLEWAKSTRAELHRKKDAGPLEREEEQLLRRCDEYIGAILRCDQSTYSLTVLGVEGFLPGYGVYEGGITASAQRGVGPTRLRSPDRQGMLPKAAGWSALWFTVGHCQKATGQIRSAPRPPGITSRSPANCRVWCGGDRLATGCQGRLSYL